MFQKDPCSFSGNAIPEKDIFLTGNDPKEACRKAAEHSFLYTGITFIISFFLAGSIPSLIPADAENKLLYFLKDFLAGSIFFLPVAAAAIITRSYGRKRFDNSKNCIRNFLPFLPPLFLKEKNFFFFLQVPFFAVFFYRSRYCS